jgi:hypothetical protein
MEERDQAPPGARAPAGFVAWVAVALIVAAAAIVRLRLLGIPLERDEGEYAYAGQLILQGIPPYKLAFNMKFPGVYAAYAVIMALFGETTGGIHLGFLFVNAATTVLVYLLGRRLFANQGGIAAAATWAVFSIGEGVLGTQAHATHFVVAAAMCATLLLLRAMDRQNLPVLLLSGILYGIAVLMKQHGILFGAFGVFALIHDHWSRGASHRVSLVKKLAVLFAGILSPLVLTGLILWRAGVFGQFWFWTVEYARAYAAENSLADGVAAFRSVFPHVVGPGVLLWVAAALGLVLVWLPRENRKSAIFAVSLLVFSMAAVCPGLYFREHYFVLMLPAVALLAGAAVNFLCRLAPRASAGTWLLFVAALALPVFQQRGFLFRLSPDRASRLLYGGNPFPEAVRIAAYIRSHSASDARIGVLGSEPEIPFYAHRHAASGYLYTYPLMEPQPFAMKMQTDFIREFEESRPEYIVVVAAPTSWLRRPDSQALIFDWWRVYGPQHYKLAGVAEIVSPTSTEYHSIDESPGDLEAWRPRSEWFVQIYKRTGA